MSMFSFDKKPHSDSKPMKLAGDTARACLGTEVFKRYRDQYAKTEREVIEELLAESLKSYVEGDMQKFGFKCLVKLTRLRDLRSLLTKVKNDSTKGLEDGKEKDQQEG